MNLVRSAAPTSLPPPACDADIHDLELFSPNDTPRSSVSSSTGAETESDSGQHISSMELSKGVSSEFPESKQHDKDDGSLELSESTLAAMQAQMQKQTAIPESQPPRQNGLGSRPSRRALFPSQVPPEEAQKLPIRANAEECLFYIHTGWCGYGSGCRYNHPPEKMALHKPKAYNSQGLPLREDAQDCQYFVRMATCKFGATCKFNHPQSIIEAAQQQQPALPRPAASPQQGPQPYLAFSAPTSPSHLSPRRARTSPSSAQASPVPSPSLAFAGQSLAAPTGAAFAQPYIVYYVQQTPEPCWQFLTMGRCQLGHQCPFLH